MAAHGVIVAVAGSSEANVVQAVDAAPGLHVVRRCADLAEAVGAASAGLGSVVVVSDQPHLTRAVLADMTTSGVAVVGVPTTPEAADQLRTLGVKHLVAPHVAQQEIAGVMNAAVAALADGGVPGVSGDEQGPLGGDGDRAARPRPASDLIAVWGPTGAPGRTTVAVNLASELSREGAQVLLVDADTYGGAVAQACGLTDEAPGLAAVARTAQHGTLDGSVLARHALELAPRLRVLTGITRAERWGELPAAALDEVWRAARAWADITVVDCGFALETDEDLIYDTHVPQRNGATLSALGAATGVIAVGSAEPLGLQRLVHTLSALRHVSPVEPVIVVNRVRREVAGARPDEAVADALLRFAQVPHAWMIPWDPRACDAATLAGQSLAERAPKSKARRAIAALAHEFAKRSQILSAPHVTRVVHAEVGH